MSDCKCPKCGSIFVNMIISVLTEQPIQYFKTLPDRIYLTPETSPVSAMVNWRDIEYICGECRYSSKDRLNFV